MTKSKFNRIVPVALVGIVLGGTTLALAAPGATQGADGADGAKRNCSGEHKDGAARFQKADKNNDGFITKDEAGAERWERIKVADVNNDGKISQAEMKQAHEEGKLGHKRS
jgi:lipopolysaccharide export LptBFGC system permease protein LptF